MLEIKNTEFVRVKYAQTGAYDGRPIAADRSNMGDVIVHPYVKHTRRFPGVTEQEYRAWVQSRYSDDWLPVTMRAEFMAWRLE